MELKVNEVAIPEQITFNYEELRNELTEKVSMYETLVYTDEQIKEAKEDKANLNKLKKALNDERIALEKKYMQPFETFKAQVNDIIRIIDKPIAVIDKQVKEFEQKEKDEKLETIKELFASVGFQPFVNLEMIFDNKWLNKTFSMKKIEDAMKERMFQIGNDVKTLNDLSEFGFEALEIYKTTLDINRALAEGRKLADIQKKKKEQQEAEERRKAELEACNNSIEQNVESVSESENAPAGKAEGEVDVKEIPEEWVAFRCLLSVEDAQALGQFFKSRNITYIQIQEDTKHGSK